MAESLVLEWIDTLSYSEDDNGALFCEKVKSSLDHKKVVHITTDVILSQEKLRLFFDQVTSGIGNSLEIAEDYKTGEKLGQKWMEIRYDKDIPDMAAYRHSKNAQPLHTDESYMTPASEIMVMYCVNRAPSGGETVFYDSVDLIEILKEENKSLLDRLATTEICFSKADSQRIKKVIDLDSKEPILNWNYYCISPNESTENKTLAREFHEFLQEHVVESSGIVSVDLKPGEGVLWWDDRVLHGRNSFTAYETNDRFLWKSGIKLT